MDTLIKTAIDLSKKIGCYQEKEYSAPFNIILATSDIYYRENFHSDIIAYILENKKETLKYFINYINVLTGLPEINIVNYQNVEVVREENKIDVLVRDEESKHCIIIENKINNAGDMPRQLPRYYKLLTDENYIVDKIIYFSLDGKKIPDKSTWTKEDKQLGIDKLIFFATAADGTKNDFINSFLIPCKNNAKDEQEISFYCQYINLLEYLRSYQMDQAIMEKFYKEMLNIDQFKVLINIRNMLNDFTTYRRDRIYDYFFNNYYPFEKIGKYLTNHTVFENICDIAANEYIKLEVIVEDDYSELWFWIQEPNTKSDLIKKILENISEDKHFEKEECNSYCRRFKFPEEDGIMYEYITKLLALLNKY